MTVEAPVRFQYVPPGSIDRDFVPQNEVDMARCLADPFWRIESGQLYKITIKAGEGETIVPFRPNRAQRRFLRRMWHRNVILKARQLGFTTLISIMWLDHALFNDHQLCLQVAQTREDAEAIFAGKVMVAYNNLPPALLAAKPAIRSTKKQLELCNGSVVRVATSGRGGTPHRLHVSEMGKIGAKFPEKSREIVSGSFPAVPLDGVIVVESTAEGQEGDFKNIVDGARELAELGNPLNPKQFRFHFYPWWGEPTYRLNPLDASLVPITAKEHEYFDKLQDVIGQEIDLGQRAWWVSTFTSECLSDMELMWREYPSTPDEAFKVSTEGTWLAAQLAKARESGRIGAYPHLEGFPVNTFWDIGNTDGTAVWLHQHVNGMDRFFAFIEDWEKPYSHFINELQKIGTAENITWGVHHLPHDADQQRQQADRVASPKDELVKLKGIGGRWVIVPRVAEFIHGIQRLRKSFSGYCFDQAGCKEGLARLTNYRKKWNRQAGTWSSEPVKGDGNSEAPDALRQHAQGFKPGNPANDESFTNFKKRKRSWS